MTKIRLEEDIWLLVCDAKKALLLQNAGDDAFPKLETRHVMEHAVHRAQDIGTDAPGRTFSGAGGRRSSVDEGDLHLEEERRFLRTVVEELARRVEGGEIRRLILVAPPRALGLLRELENAHLKRATVAELPHDYVKLPLYEIEARLKSQH